MSRLNRPGQFLIVGLLILSTCLCTLCAPRTARPSPAPSAQEKAGLTVLLAGSELKDLEPLLPEIERATGVKMTFQYSGTLEGAEQVSAGAADNKYDFAWFSQTRYIHLFEGTPGRVQAQEEIMLSPVVVGVKTSKAKSWGWVKNPNLTWGDIAAKAGSGELRYAMADPAASNSGFSALVGVTASLAEEADALQTRQISAVSGELKSFYKGQALSASGSGWLADRYVLEQDRLDGMINYESVLLELNKSGQLKDPFTLVYPKEGVITADYALLLINPGQRAAYQKVVAYLRSPAFQHELMSKTLRRPVNSEIKLSSDFPTQLLVELPFPGSLQVVNQLLSAGPDQQVRPVHTYYVLDTSQAMRGSQLDNLKKAVETLTGAENGPASRFTRFHNSEKVTIITFNDRVSAGQDFTVDISQPASLGQLQDYIRGLRAGGGSALYSALSQAYQQAARDKTREPERVYSIVLMSRGQSDTGISEKKFLDGYRKSGSPDIHLFALFFGDSEMEIMRAIADKTGGRLLVAGQNSLSVIFNEIRGYK